MIATELQLQQRIEELETKVAFQEDTINNLSEELATHTQRYLIMQDQLRQMMQRLKAIQPNNIATESEETPPPHY